MGMESSPRRRMGSLDYEVSLVVYELDELPSFRSEEAEDRLSFG